MPHELTFLTEKLWIFLSAEYSEDNLDEDYPRSEDNLDEDYPAEETEGDADEESNEGNEP